MLEKTIQTKIIKYLESEGAFVVKVSIAGKSGVPDLLVCYKGMFIAIEVKRANGVVSELQKIKIQRIEDAGGYAMVAYSVDDVRELLNDINSQEM